MNQPHRSTTIILELRTYDFAPGDARRYLALFQTDGLPLITAHMPLLGYWITEIGPLSPLHHARAYSDLYDRRAGRACFLSDPDWTQGFLRGMALIRQQESRLVAVKRTSPAFDAAAEAADRRHDAHPVR